MSQKRNRSTNWDEEEKQLFCSVLKEYSQIIENKALDTNTNKIKTKAWEDVHTKFNQINSRPRELSQLKIQWKSMKINARKKCSTFKRETNKTGGGARPPTPDDSFIVVKDLLNPAELLRDHNSFDSDGIVIGELKCPIKIQDTKVITEETIEDVDEQVVFQKCNPGVSHSNIILSATAPMEKYRDTPPVEISEDDVIIATPINKSMGFNQENRVPKRKILLKNSIGNSLKSRKNQDDYVSSMLSHSKMLKDEEHTRHMEMAEEEHKIKMKIHETKLKIHEEQLKSAILEREILEFKKNHEASLLFQNS